MASQSRMVIETILSKIDAGTLNPGNVIAEDVLIAELEISRVGRVSLARARVGGLLGHAQQIRASDEREVIRSSRSY